VWPSQNAPCPLAPNKHAPWRGKRDAPFLHRRLPPLSIRHFFFRVFFPPLGYSSAGPVRFFRFFFGSALFFPTTVHQFFTGPMVGQILLWMDCCLYVPKIVPPLWGFLMTCRHSFTNSWTPMPSIPVTQSTHEVVIFAFLEPFGFTLAIGLFSLVFPFFPYRFFVWILCFPFPSFPNPTPDLPSPPLITMSPPLLLTFRMSPFFELELSFY